MVKEKICNYIQREINPYGKPFKGTVYDFGTKIINYIEAIDDGWKSTEENLPEESDCEKNYLCLIKDHTDEFPMVLQYSETDGFGFYMDCYDTSTKEFIKTKFAPIEEKCGKVAYWVEIPKFPKEYYE